MQLPTVGSHVEVTTVFANTNYFTMLDQPFVEHTHQGIVVKNPAWLESDYFTVKTGKPGFPLSMISSKVVKSIKILQGSTDDTKHFEVKGSKGDVYVVSVRENQYSCTCVGFKFNNKCKHIEGIKDGKKS